MPNPRQVPENLNGSKIGMFPRSGMSGLAIEAEPRASSGVVTQARRALVQVQRPAIESLADHGGSDGSNRTHRLPFSATAAANPLNS